MRDTKAVGFGLIKNDRSSVHVREATNDRRQEMALRKEVLASLVLRGQHPATPLIGKQLIKCCRRIGVQAAASAERSNGLVQLILCDKQLPAIDAGTNPIGFEDRDRFGCRAGRDAVHRHHVGCPSPIDQHAANKQHDHNQGTDEPARGKTHRPELGLDLRQISFEKFHARPPCHELLNCRSLSTGLAREHPAQRQGPATLFPYTRICLTSS